MDIVKVKKEELLSILIENRKKHEKDYKEATRAYRVKCGDLINQELNKIVNGEKFDMDFSVSKPISHLKDYDVSIKMLEMSVEDIIELTHHEFIQLVNDDWSWKTSFRSTIISNSSYYGRSGFPIMTGTIGTTVTESDRSTSSTEIEVNFSDDELD